MGTGSSAGAGVGHPPPSSAEVEGRVELYICSLSGPSWPVLWRTLPLYILHLILTMKITPRYVAWFTDGLFRPLGIKGDYFILQFMREMNGLRLTFIDINVSEFTPRLL